ncbi:MAG: alpha-hydroxy-acid oxidizing protein, partial [Syntrophothermus sp.]
GVRFNMGGYMTELDYTRTVLEGSKLAGTMGWTGDGPHPEIFAAAQDAIGESGGVAIVKPREDEVILEYFRKLEEARPVAVGVDVDGAGAITMALQGQPVGPKLPESLRKIVKASSWPFILKGIMTPDEAELAVEVGAAAIVVSNHGGRVLDHTPGTAEVLPGIAEKVKGKIAIIADGGVRSGVDVLKFLALGADAVLVGRPLVIGAYGGGAEGVAFVLRRMADELRQAMILTGCANLADIGPRVLAV